MASLPCSGSKGAPSWCDRPRLGEADRPGPGGGFDVAESSESDHDDWHPFPGDTNWMPDALIDDADDSEYPAMLEQPATPPRAVEAWLAKNAGNTFVDVGGPATNQKHTLCVFAAHPHEARKNDRMDPHGSIYRVHSPACKHQQ